MNGDFTSNTSWFHGKATWDQIREKYCNTCPRHTCGGCLYFHYEPVYNTNSIVNRMEKRTPA